MFRITYWVVVRLLIVLFLRSFIFFVANFVHYNIALFVVAGFMMAMCPRLVRFLLFPPASLLLLGLWELWLRPVLLALPFCLFFFFFLLFFCCFALFLFLASFVTTMNLLVFSFFLFFRARFLFVLFVHAYDSPVTPFAT